MMPFRILASLLAAAFALGACGAKTGLIVDVFERDATLDVPDVVLYEACTVGHFGLLRRSAEVLFVIDRSGSMEQNIDGTAAPPRKWDVLYDALATTLPPFEHTLLLGGMAFPHRFGGTGARACSINRAIDSSPALNNSIGVLGILSGSDPWGGTPTADAMTFSGSVLAADVSRSRSVQIVLTTDGGPNCNTALDPNTCACTDPNPPMGRPCDLMGSFCLDDVRSVASIQSLAMQGVPTYVIGLDSALLTAERDALNAMAIAGGRPNRGAGGFAFYGARRSEELTAAFQSITQSIAQCAFLTPSQPDNPDQIRVTLGGNVLPRDTTHADGWDWTDTHFGEITLYGSACRRVVDSGAIPEADVLCSER